MEMEMERIRNYVNGKWIKSETERFLPVENPSTGEILAQLPVSTKQEIDFAVASSNSAFLKWRELPVTERVKYLFQLKILLEQHFEEIARTTTMENGKTLDEAKGDTKRLLENVDAAMGIPSLIQGKILLNIAHHIDEYFVREPLGVFVNISPFNFPGMIPFWFLPYAVACGNTFIVKQSSETPLTMTRIFELIDAAGFPPGVLNLIQGNREIGDYLIEHPDVCGICSVTSTPVAEHIYSKGAGCGKRLCCQAGAKNFLVVMEDAVLSKAVPNIISSTFGNAGERCLAGTNIVAVGNVYDKLLKMLLKAASHIKVGYGLEPDVDMGPVISQKAKNRIEGYIQTGIEEGARLVMDGRNIKVEKYPLGHYLGPNIFTGVRPEMKIAQEEIFGPVMNIIRAENLKEAINMINNQNEFGNASTIYTSAGKSAQKFANEVNCGNIGINIGVVAPIALFPFSGRKKSFFGTLHGQLPDALDFFTDKKVVITRWW
jgi:malonate-semialdehyde dehydrogenase (acetylating)/methylmalonate-semialdehyde dehydrogenase